MKQRLIKEYGSLRVCSVKTGINYYRISAIVNGWKKPREDEMKLLKITNGELKRTLKV